LLLLAVNYILTPPAVVQRLGAMYMLYTDISPHSFYTTVLTRIIFMLLLNDLLCSPLHQTTLTSSITDTSLTPLLDVSIATFCYRGGIKFLGCGLVCSLHHSLHEFIVLSTLFATASFVVFSRLLLDEGYYESTI
jgi:hypothetical protein